jgi:hypothetical protein
MILDVVKLAIGAGTHIMTNRQKRKMLESDAAMLHAQKMANGEVEYQQTVRQSTLANGGIDSMDEYKYIIGKIHAIDLINQELSNLLEPKEQKDDDNITRIRS